MQIATESTEPTLFTYNYFSSIDQKNIPIQAIQISKEIKCEPEFIQYNKIANQQNEVELKTNDTNSTIELMSLGTANSYNQVPTIPVNTAVSETVTVSEIIAVHTAPAQIEPQPQKPQKKTKIPNYRYACNLCPKIYDRKSRLTAHLAVHGPFKCEFCAEIFTKKPDLLKHLDALHEKPFKCDTCPKSFFCKRSVKEHILSHTVDDEKPFKCGECDKAFTRSASLKYHEQMHRSTATYQCTICTKVFARQKLMKNHMQTHNMKMYTCDICLKEFAAKYTFFNHTTAECPICLQNIFCKEALKEHIVKHQSPNHNRKMYKCTMCYKIFNRNAKLNEHMITHTDAKPYSCEICSKTFVLKRSFTEHMSYHNGENKCDLCAKTFARKASLSLHVDIVHFGAKPYKCTMCTMTFAHRSGLRGHYGREHE